MIFDLTKRKGNSGGGNADSDYITVCVDFVTVGANNVTRSSEIAPYLKGLANMPTSDEYATIWSVVDHSGSWEDNAAICYDLTSFTATTPRFYRYRNGGIAATPLAANYDAKLQEGDKYMIATYYWKGAPS